MRKNVIVACCVTLYLLSAVPENQGSKLLESFSCILHHLGHQLTCTWLENDLSEKLLNMTLKEVTKGSELRNACMENSVTRSLGKNSTWTCNIHMEKRTASDIINFSFVPGRNLETRLNVAEERDDAKPQNLRCNDTDGNIMCSWQVRKEIAESIDFDLFYDNDEKECQPVCHQDPSEYLSCRCTIMTDGHQNSSALLKTISVNPRKPERSFRSVKLCLIYQLPPRNLTIRETKKGEDFSISWKDNSTTTFKFRYQYELCYWEQMPGQTVDEVPDTCPDQTLEISHLEDSSVIFQLGKQLKPSTNYSVMVRVKLYEVNSNCFQGPWSQWSKVHTLTTKEVPNLILLYVLVPICVIILVMFALCGYKALVRYTKQWDENLPNPNKSSIIKGLQMTKSSMPSYNGSGLPYEDHLYVEPYNVWMWTPSASKDSPHVYHDEERICRLDGKLTTDKDAECPILCGVAADRYPTASIVDEYKSFTELTNEQESQDFTDSQFTFSAFDGPYLLSESNFS